MTPEGKVQKTFRTRVKETGGRTRKFRWLDRNGGADQFTWWPGPRMAFVELKALGEKPSVLQARDHARLRADGFEVFVIDDEAGIENFIRHMTT